MLAAAFSFPCQFNLLRVVAHFNSSRFDWVMPHKQY